MLEKTFNFGPLALTNAAANICNPPTATGGVNGGSSAQEIILYGLSIVNKTNVPHNFSLFKGATGGSAAGTEIIGSSLNVAANSTFEWRGRIVLQSTDFLTGLADANTALTIFGFGVIGVSG